MTVSKFNSLSTTYKCGICQKRTRDTGRGELGLELCAKCLLTSYADNAFQDYGKDSEEYKKASEELKSLKKQKKKQEDKWVAIEYSHENDLAMFPKLKEKTKNSFCLK